MINHNGKNNGYPMPNGVQNGLRVFVNEGGTFYVS